MIVTQTPPYVRKHPGGDRTGYHMSQAKITSELAKVINDGLYYYEQDLWMEEYENKHTAIKDLFECLLQFFILNFTQPPGIYPSY